MTVRRLTLVLTSVILTAVVVVVGKDLVSRFLERREFEKTFEPLGPNAQGRDEFRHRETGIVFVSLPGGDFEFGREVTTFWGLNAKESRPGRKVTLEPFLIAKYELSQEEWLRVMSANPSFVQGEQLPVESVSFAACEEFCEKSGLRLPTPEQWEYACKAGSDRRFAIVGELDDSVWYAGNSHNGAQAVGSKSPNRFGIHDMHGNVREWCRGDYLPDLIPDFIRSELDEQQTERIAAAGREIIAARFAGYHIRRGGCWGSSQSSCAATAADGQPDEFARADTGFRPVWLHESTPADEHED